MFKANSFMDYNSFVINNYWMRLSMIRRIMQLDEGVIHLSPSLFFAVLAMVLSSSAISSCQTCESFCHFLTEATEPTTAITVLLLAVACAVDDILLDVSNFFQIWSTLADVEELPSGFKPIRNREIYWMDNIILSKLCLYCLKIK